ncbi:uncharacterized protein LOC131620966 [Vicia villosa]|uniref:uncharacterized protein LOC131620966 n=1 Tax=Vicia villosa TaxID=3911 RepID=UPI00273AA128|nr:uncharacterized protein LOC131620966 [Vicia villosa]
MMERTIVIQAVVETSHEGSAVVEEEVATPTNTQLKDRDDRTMTPRNSPRVIRDASPIRVPTPQIGGDEKPKGRLWSDVIQGNRDLKRGMEVEFIASTVVNGEDEVSIEDADVEDELHYWENALILFALRETLSMNAVKRFMEKDYCRKLRR